MQKLEELRGLNTSVGSRATGYSPEVVGSSLAPCGLHRTLDFVIAYRAALIYRIYAFLFISMVSLRISTAVQPMTGIERIKYQANGG